MKWLMVGAGLMFIGILFGYILGAIKKWDDDE